MTLATAICLTSADAQTLSESLRAKLDTIIETSIPSPRSEVVEYHFNGAFCNELEFYSEHWEKGVQKTYTVHYDDNGMIDDDVDYETKNDGGYCSFHRLPKAVRTACEEIIKLSLEIDAAEALRDELAESEDNALDVELVEASTESIKAEESPILHSVVVVSKGMATLVTNNGHNVYVAFRLYTHSKENSDKDRIELIYNDMRYADKIDHSKVEQLLMKRFEPLRKLHQL